MAMEPKVEWISVVKRKTSLAFQFEVARQGGFIKKIIDFPVNYFWYNGITYEVGNAKQELYGLGAKISEKIKSDISFAKKNAELCHLRCDDLIVESEKVRRIDLKHQSHEQLLKELLEFLDAFRNLIPFILIPHSVERFILGEIEKELNGIKGKEKYLEIFTTSIEDDTTESESALRIAVLVKKQGWTSEAILELKKHTEEFCWIPVWGLTDDPFTNAYFKDEISILVNKISNPQAEIERVRHQRVARQREFDLALKELNASPYLKGLAYIMQSYVFLRTYRKNAYSKANYSHLPLLFEIAKRMGISKEEIKYLTYEEIIDFLKSGKVVNRKVLAKRLDGWAVLSWEGKQFVLSGKSEVQNVIKKYGIFFVPSHLSQQIKGRTACRGKVQGLVRLVRDLKDLGRVKKGDILVARMTTPDYMAAIYKSAGIVTDEGGVTSHAAIISRELSIPCIIGTGNATQALHDGDHIELDANRGEVHILKS